ncbi:piggyBac transposable element-derived protein 5-like isoform X2 [Branchiostoma floridae]|uniref:PiggyBac transposable element-derived protein 5-like isoform X2 n=1 Tax=Branchiostoma floridae TaxID=7739 RepID=A0A9J7KN88_BRAFL|nr:piggyBac transposable element-derived protein 5-like isoform X2 [Branchiostoma floridae]
MDDEEEQRRPAGLQHLLRPPSNPADHEGLQISDDMFGGSASSDDASTGSEMSQSDDDDEDSEEMGDADEDGGGSADDGGWTADITHFDPPCFSDGETVGPVRDVTPDMRPIDFFHLLVPEPVLSAIVQQTNRYAHKYQLKNGRDEEWRNVDLAEMKAFMAIFMYTSLVHGVFSEDISALWEADEITYNPVMASILTQRRFQRIMRYFHVVSSSGQQQGDSLRKIRPFLETVQNSFRNEFKTAQTHVIHEPPLEEEPLMWSRHLDRKRRKKKRFNLWVRQCTATGFISQIHIHVKEKSDSLSHHEKGYSVARDLCSDLIGSGRNHIVFCIPANTSLRLFRELESHGVYGCGVVTDARHTDCEGLPASVLAKPPTSLRKYDSIVRTKGRYSAVLWNSPRNPFRLLTNAFSPAAQGKLVVKKNRRPDEERPCLEAVQAFQNHIKYIDKYNEKYSWYIISYKPSKTWQQLFWTVLSLAMNNAYIMYKLSPAHAHSRLSRSDFGAELLRAMAGPYYQEPPTQGEE